MDHNKRKSSNGSQSKRPGRTDVKNNKKSQQNGLKGPKAKETPSKASLQSDSGTPANESPVGTGNPELYENMEIHYVDDAHGDPKTGDMAADQNKDGLDGNSSDMDKESNRAKEEESDSDTLKDSASSQGDSLAADEENLERAPIEAPKRISKKKSVGSSPNGLVKKADKERNKLQSKALQSTHQKSENSAGESREFTQPDSSIKSMEGPPEPSSESSEGVDDKPTGNVKEVDVLDETSNVAQNFGSFEKVFNATESGVCKDEAAFEQKIEEMEMRIEKLEEELREAAALEISLYSVVAEHGSSAHKVHTPARRLSRLYIHACKYWTLNKRATIAKNTVSGLVLIARSCSNDVSRLTFWLSNTVVLREIISQAFGGSRKSGFFSKFLEANGDSKKSEVKAATLKWKGSSSTKQNNGIVLSLDDWQETGTFVGALEKVESWIFSRIVESIWWQAFTPHMQTPDADADACANKVTGRLLGPSLGDQQQGSFSINLWKNAFQDAFSRLCPVRAGGHECGCLPVLAKMVMEQCISRLDVAMFNAILRESAHEIPTDPVSDPIVDSKVLPIPAGDLSFGSGAQLKNSIGNWSRWITEAFSIGDDFVAQEDKHGDEDEHRQAGDSESKTFILLNELSDLLMLPKDMIVDRSIRDEVCPLIGLPLIKRVLCNFTPDEFCLDPVPGAVLEALNAETIVERQLSGDTMKSFPYTAAAVVYNPPSAADVGEKVAEAGEQSWLSRNVSVVQRKGYTSDEELEDLDSPLASIIDKMQLSPTIKSNGDGNGHSTMNARYELLREAWSV